MNATTRIEKNVELNAPVSRVWRAITDASEFSRWFGIELDDVFAEGKIVTGTFDQNLNEAGIMEYQKQHGLTPSKVNIPEKGTTFCTVERIDPEKYFSFRWVPYGVDAEADPENEPTTLVEFHLAPTSEGTRLTIAESGFECVPAHRRERAFLMNTGGWSGQIENIKQYVEND